ncbi:MAG TPA: bifunctional chorismate-binding protein/class IV aminotransferase [Pseudogracilibacillus sp.]|nr:bifunctional chorismate-binding protein/class IV aminotransferase [Pseudogracilibacillus sp.]
MNNNSINNSVFLRFDFTNEVEPVCFTEPVQIITTNLPDEVPQCLQAIERATSDGYYVAGYMSFELSYALFYPHLLKELKKPLLWFGVFSGKCEHLLQGEGDFSISKWTLTSDKERYETDLKHILKEIDQGTYSQINYTTMWQADFQGHPYAYYKELKHAQQAHYAAFLQLPDEYIASLSPELFFYRHKEQIKVRPMKGTIHRGKTYEEDLALKEWLQTSHKNRQENKLTTDLMVEELEEIADHVQVTKPYMIEQYPTVYQMTSEVEGTLHETVTFSQLVNHLFPCTSIAGTPKKVTLKEIKALESFSRHVYCGAIGYITPDDEAIFNVPIRTLQFDKKEGLASYGAGGAITKGSDIVEEYKEVLTKTGILNKKYEAFELIETLAIKEGQALYDEEHLQRLIQSASYFNYPFDQAAFKQIVSQACQQYQSGYWRLRLTLNEAGCLDHTVTEESVIKEAVVTFADEPIHRNNIYLYHKTTNRKIYQERKEQHPDVFDVLLMNERHEVTEFTIGNLVIELDGKLYTPPVTSGLLAGTFRQYLLNAGQIEEKVLYKEDVLKAEKIWLINSVREWVKVSFH